MFFRKFVSVFVVQCLLFTALGAPFAQARGFEEAGYGRLRPLSHSMEQVSKLSSSMEDVREILARGLLNKPKKFTDFFKQYQKQLKKLDHPAANFLDRLLFTYPVQETATGKRAIFGSTQEKDHCINFVMVFSKEGALEQTLEEDEQMMVFLLGKKFEVEEGWELKDIRTKQELWKHFIIEPQIHQLLLEFKKDSTFFQSDEQYNDISVPQTKMGRGYLWEWALYFIPFQIFGSWAYDHLHSVKRGSVRHEKSAAILEFVFASCLSLGIFLTMVSPSSHSISIPFLISASLLRGFPVAYLFSGAHKGKWNENSEEKFARIWSRRIVGYILSQVLVVPAIWYSIYWPSLPNVIGQYPYRRIIETFASWLIGAVLVVRLQWIYDTGVRKKWLPPFWHIADIVASNSLSAHEIAWLREDIRRSGVHETAIAIEAKMGRDIIRKFVNSEEVNMDINFPKKIVTAVEKVLMNSRVSNLDDSSLNICGLSFPYSKIKGYDGFKNLIEDLRNSSFFLFQQDYRYYLSMVSLEAKEDMGWFSLHLIQYLRDLLGDSQEKMKIVELIGQGKQKIGDKNFADLVRHFETRDFPPIKDLSITPSLTLRDNQINTETALPSFEEVEHLYRIVTKEKGHAQKEVIKRSGVEQTRISKFFGKKGTRKPNPQELLKLFRALKEFMQIQIPPRSPSLRSIRMSIKGKPASPENKQAIVEMIHQARKLKFSYKFMSQGTGIYYGTIARMKNKNFPVGVNEAKILLERFKEILPKEEWNSIMRDYFLQTPGAIFYPLRELWPRFSMPINMKQRAQNFLGWLGEPLVVAPWWETVVFSSIGFLTYAYGAAVGSPELMNFGLAWATLGFSFAHTIVRWIARAIQYPDTFALLLMENRRSVLEIILLDLRDFLARTVLSFIFLLPYLVFDPFSATVLSIYAHSRFNYLVLSGLLPAWLPVMAIGLPIQTKAHEHIETLTAFADLVATDMVRTHIKPEEFEKNVQAYALARMEILSAINSKAMDEVGDYTSIKNLKLVWGLPQIAVALWGSDYRSHLVGLLQAYFESKDFKVMLPKFNKEYDLVPSNFSQWLKKNKKIFPAKLAGKEKLSQLLKNIIGFDPQGIQDRFNILFLPYVYYFMSVCKIVNPDHENLVGVYGGSGADIACFLLSTDAKVGYFVTNNRVDPFELQSYLRKWDWKTIDFDYTDEVYTSKKRLMGYGGVNFLESHPDTIYWAILAELKSIGVEKDSIKIGSVEGHTQLSFNWTHPNAKKKRNYTIYFINSKIENFGYRKNSSDLLREILEGGIDFYYEKAGVNISKSWHEFLPSIAGAIKVNGMVITDDFDVDLHPTDPMPYLEKMGSKFIQWDSTYSMRWWRMLIPFASSRDSGYGWELKIRKKIRSSIMTPADNMNWEQDILAFYKNGDIKSLKKIILEESDSGRINQAWKAFELFLKEDLSYDFGRDLFVSIQSLVYKKNITIPESLVRILEENLRNGKIGQVIFSESIKCLMWIYMKQPQLINESISETIEVLLKRQNLSALEFYALEDLITHAIAKKRPDLLRASFVKETISALQHGQFGWERNRSISRKTRDSLVYSSACDIIKTVVTCRPDLILESSILNIVEALFSYPNFEDYVYSGAADTLAAISAKHPSYVTHHILSTLNSFISTEKNKKLENFVTRHVNHAIEKILRKRFDLFNTELIKTQEEILRTDGYEDEIYKTTAEIIRFVASKQPAVIQKSTVESLMQSFQRKKIIESFFSGKDTSQNQYIATFEALLIIFKKRTELVSLTEILGTLESFLRNSSQLHTGIFIFTKQIVRKNPQVLESNYVKTLQNYANKFLNRNYARNTSVLKPIADCFKEIIYRRLDLIDQSTLNLLMRILKVEDLQPKTYLVVLDVFKYLIEAKPGFKQVIFFALESLMTQQGHEASEYRYAVGLMKRIVKKNPEIEKADGLFSVIKWMPEKLLGHPFHHWKIFEDAYFRMWTKEELAFYEAYSVANSIYELLEFSHLRVTKKNIEKGLEVILTLREMMSHHPEQIVFGPNVNAINILHQANEYNQGNLEFLELQAGTPPGKIQSFKGFSQKENALEAIRQSKGATTIYIHGHGGGKDFSLDSKEVNSQSLDNEKLPIGPYSINFEELADALLERGNLDQVKLIVDCCYPYNFSRLVLGYFIGKIMEEPEKEFGAPIVVAANSLGRYIYAGIFVEGLKNVLSAGSPLTLTDIFKAEKFTFEYEDPILLIPNPEPVYNYIQSKIPKIRWPSYFSIGSIFYQFYEMGKIVDPKNWKERMRNFFGWLGEPFTVAPTWETLAFPLVGVGLALGWDWATWGFAAAHIIARWIHRAKYRGWNSEPLWLLLIKDVRDFFTLYIISHLFLVPYLILDPISASVVTYYLHSRYNRLVLNDKFPQWLPWLPVATIFDDFEELGQRIMKSSPMDWTNVEMDNRIFDGLDAYGFGNYTDAETIFREVLQEGPEHSTAWINLGVTLSQLDRYPEAIYAQTRAVGLGNSLEQVENNWWNFQYIPEVENQFNQLGSWSQIALPVYSMPEDKGTQMVFASLISPILDSGNSEDPLTLYLKISELEEIKFEIQKRWIEYFYGTLYREGNLLEVDFNAISEDREKFNSLLQRYPVLYTAIDYSLIRFYPIATSLQQNLKEKLRNRVSKDTSIIPTIVEYLHHSSLPISDSALDWLLGLDFKKNELVINRELDRKKLYKENLIYEGTSYDKIRNMLRTLRLSAQDVLYDMGFGYGRVLIYAALALPHLISLKGVEILEERFEQVAQAKMNLNLNQIELSKGDVLNQDFNIGDIFFLFNPFVRPTLEIVAATLKEIANNKKIRVATWGSPSVSYFQTYHHDWLEPLHVLTDRSLDPLIIFESPEPNPPLVDVVEIKDETGRTILADIRNVRKLGVVGDVQSNYKKTRAALKKAGFVNNKGNWSADNSVLVFLGDLLDGGPNPWETLEFIYDLSIQAEKKNGKVIVLTGNHEELFLNWLEGEQNETTKKWNMVWRTNGGPQTVKDLLQEDISYEYFTMEFRDMLRDKLYQRYPKLKEIIPWLKNLPYAARINQSILLVHAGPDFLADRFEDLANTKASRHKMTWDRDWIYNSFRIQQAMNRWGLDYIVYGHTIEAPHPSADQGIVTEIIPGVLNAVVFRREAPKGGAQAVLNFEFASAVGSDRRTINKINVIYGPNKLNLKDETFLEESKRFIPKIENSLGIIPLPLFSQMDSDLLSLVLLVVVSIAAIVISKWKDHQNRGDIINFPVKEDSSLDKELDIGAPIKGPITIQENSGGKIKISPTNEGPVVSPEVVSAAKESMKIGTNISNIVSIQHLSGEGPTEYEKAVQEEFFPTSEELEYEYEEGTVDRAKQNNLKHYVPLLQRIYNIYGDLKGKRVLELDAGPGVIVDILRRRGGVDSHGLESNSHYIQFARSNEVPLYQGALEGPRYFVDLPEEKQFDVTFSNYVLDEFSNSIDIFRERVMQLIEDTTVLNGLSFHVTSEKFPFYSEELEQHGLSIIKTHPIKNGYFTLLKRVKVPIDPDGIKDLKERKTKIKPSVIPPLADMGPWRALTPYTQNRVVEATQTKFKKLKETNLIAAFSFGLTHWRRLTRKPNSGIPPPNLVEEIALVSQGLAKGLAPNSIVKDQNIRILTNQKGLDSAAEEFKRLRNQSEDKKLQIVVVADPRQKAQETILNELEEKEIPRSYAEVIYRSVSADGTFSFSTTLLENPWLTEEDYSLRIIKNDCWSDILGKVLNTRFLADGSQLVELDLKSALAALTSQ